MNRVDRFMNLIEQQPHTPLPGNPTAELVQPLHDLAEALNQRAGVEAAVQQSADGRRYHLALWPKHRPADRSLMVTIAIVNGGGIVLGNARTSFATADELTEWIERFLMLPEFNNSLANLRLAADEPVGGRLERANGMATMVWVPAHEQAELAQWSAGREREFELGLEDSEPLPKVEELRVLNSAGIIFDIVPQTASVNERVIRFRATKRGA